MHSPAEIPKVRHAYEQKWLIQLLRVQKVRNEVGLPAWKLETIPLSYRGILSFSLHSSPERELAGPSPRIPTKLQHCYAHSTPSSQTYAPYTTLGMPCFVGDSLHRHTAQIALVLPHS